MRTVAGLPPALPLPPLPAEELSSVLQAASSEPVAESRGATQGGAEQGAAAERGCDAPDAAGVVSTACGAVVWSSWFSSSREARVG